MDRSTVREHHEKFTEAIITVMAKKEILDCHELHLEYKEME